MSRFAFFVLAFAGLSACSQGGGKLGGFVMSSLTGASGGAAVAVVPIDGRSMIVTMPDRAIKFAMVPIEQDGNVTVWAAQDGAQLAFRDGVLISSRGFGMDLMSADAPTVPQLVAGAPAYTRVYHYLDGADVAVRKTYDCNLAKVIDPEPTAGLRHLQETCSSKSGTIRNDFWLNSKGHVAKATQWLSDGSGSISF